MLATGDLAQRLPRFHRHLTVGFRGRGEDHFRGVDGRFQLRLAFRQAFRLGVVELTQQIHLALGVPGDAFPAVADGFQQRADRGETLVGRRVITLNRNNMRRGFPGDEIAFAFFQSLTSSGCAISAAESCWIGRVTTSVSLPRWPTHTSENFFAIPL